MKNNVVPMSILIDMFHEMLPRYDRTDCIYEMDGHNTIIVSSISGNFGSVHFKYNNRREWCIYSSTYSRKMFEKEISLRNELSVQQNKYNNLKRSIKRHEQDG